MINIPYSGGKGKHSFKKRGIILSIASLLGGGTVAIADYTTDPYTQSREKNGHKISTPRLDSQKTHYVYYYDLPQNMTCKEIKKAFREQHKYHITSEKTIQITDGKGNSYSSKTMIQQGTRVFIKTLKQHDKLPSVGGYLKGKTIQWGEAIKSIFSSHDKELVTNGAKEGRRTKNYKNLDENGFSKGNFPFKHIEKPYKNMHAYAVDRVDWTYLLPSGKKKYLATIQMLTNPETSGDRVTCTPKDYTKNIYPNNVGNQSNNPCNISPSKSDIGYAGFKRLPDGQTHASYKNKIAGLASAMRLLRKRKTYHNHSICFINCIGGYQGGHYKEHEVDGLKALRLIWITHVANHLKVSPTTPLNLDDPETLMAVIQAIALQETSSKIGKSTLEEAYKVAFPDEK